MAAKVDPISMCAVPLSLEFGKLNIAHATGFSYRGSDGSLYFITNGHVLSGLDPCTGQPLDPSGSVPDAVEFILWQQDGRGFRDCRMELHDRKGPIWLEHPVHGRIVDVVAVDISIGEGETLFPINEKDFYADMRIAVAQDVFVIGFPRGRTVAGCLPIWKRGTIASEPEIDFDGQPKLLVDCTTVSGMSGSPVIAQFSGVHMKGAKLAPDDRIGLARKFLGVYSGRLGTNDELEPARLGIVWKAQVIEEIIAGKRRATT